jgi:predicted Zn-dependent protease
VGSSSPTRIDDELATLELSGVDASTVLADITRYATAWGAVSQTRDYPKAEAILVELRARYPKSVPILRLLAQTLLELERPDEGLTLLRKAVELAPKDLTVRLNLAKAAHEAGALDEAEEALRVATDLDPCGEKPRIKLANLLVERDRYAEQVAVLAEGVERCPDEQSFHNDYAYARATSPDPSMRDGFEALRIASEITRGAGASNPALLDTLAAAYAENGDFDRAVETSRRALELLTTREVPEEALELFRNHLESFEAGQPVREP